MFVIKHPTPTKGLLIRKKSFHCLFKIFLSFKKKNSQISVFSQRSHTLACGDSLFTLQTRWQKSPTYLRKSATSCWGGGERHTSHENEGRKKKKKIALSRLHNGAVSY